MFERFTVGAREIVVQAQAEARDLDHEHIGTEHLLLALVAQPDTRSAAALTEAGLDHSNVLRAITDATQGGDLDADALSSIGIDLDAVREKVEATFGLGALERTGNRPRRRRGAHLPFTKSAKKSLELSLREAVRLHSPEISDVHLLLGILREGDSLGYRALLRTGANPTALRTTLEAA